jgi:hypothetical protein
MARYPSRRKAVIDLQEKWYTVNGERVLGCYCRVCMQIRRPAAFLDATDTILDKNGKMSVCIECVNNLFNQYFASEQDLSKTLLKMCRLLNVVYLESAVQATITHFSKVFEKKGEMAGVFGIYKSKVSSFAQLNQVGTLTFSEPTKFVSDNPMDDDEFEEAHDVKEFWGSKLSTEDYTFLETKLASWKKTFSCSNASEEFHLREACFKELDLKKARDEGGNPGKIDAILKSMDLLLKSGALTPAQANASGKSADTVGTILKRIEMTEPAEYYKDQKLFKDYDNLLPYIINYIKRPIVNFFTGNKNYQLMDENGMVPEEENIEE